MSDIWTVTPSAVYRSEMRESMDLLAGTSLQYTGSLEGGYTGAAAELAFRVDQGVALAFSSLFTDSAPKEVLVAKLREAGLTPRAATSSRYVVKVQTSGAPPVDTVVPADARLQGGGPSGRFIWRVVEGAGDVSNGDSITIEAVETGPKTLTGITSFTWVTPVTDMEDAVYDPGNGDPFQIGNDEETVGEMRTRVKEERARGGSYPSIARAIRDIDWITAVDVRQGTAGGTIAITLVPDPVGADQEAELAEALYAGTPGGSTLEGSSFLPVEDVNGETSLVYYTSGSQQAVAVVASVTGDGTVSKADLESLMSSAISAFFDGLSAGDTAFYTRFTSVVHGLPSVIDSTTLTLDGGTADISPATAADVLVVGSLTVTATVS